MKALRLLSWLPLLLPVLQVLVPKTCYGWGTIGHEIVANVAWAGLSPEAQLWVTSILSTNSSTSSSTSTAIHNGLDHANDKQTRHVVVKAVTAIEEEENSPLGMVADWADQVRHYLPWSAPLHYIDVRDDLFAHGCHVNPSLNPQCRFLYDRDCPKDTCVAGAIVNYTHQLFHALSPPHTQRLFRGIPTTTTGVDSTSRSETRRSSNSATKEALMFLTHFIGDIHQPLHCSRLTDKGGNDIHVHFQLQPPRTTSRSSHYRHDATRHSHPHHGWNLHSVWDSGLIEVALARDYDNSRSLLEQHLIEQLDEAKQKYLHDCDPALGANRTCTIQWGQESWDAAVRYAYTMSDNRTDVMDGSTLDEDYFQTRWPLAMDRLLAGAVRLAGTLEWLVQQNNQTTITGKQTPIASSVHDNVSSPSLFLWSTLFSNPWSWTWKASMLYV